MLVLQVLARMLGMTRTALVAVMVTVVLAGSANSVSAVDPPPPPPKCAHHTIHAANSSTRPCADSTSHAQLPCCRSVF